MKYKPRATEFDTDGAGKRYYDIIGIKLNQAQVSILFYLLNSKRTNDTAHTDPWYHRYDWRIILLFSSCSNLSGRQWYR